MSLLKKDVFHLRRKSSGALAALDFAPRDSFILEVITWILTVRAQAAPLLILTLDRIVGRASSGLCDNRVSGTEGLFSGPT